MKLLLCISALLQVSAVVTEQGNLRLYWSQLRFSYSSAHKSESYSKAQQQAWTAGLAGFVAAVKEVYRQQRIAAQHVPTVVANASRHLFLQRTVFFADFSAEHQVSGNMTRLFPAEIIPPHTSDHISNPPASRNTGLIIKVAASFVPQVLYEVRDTEGKLLFDKSQVQREAFKVRLMGRYFTSADKRRIRAQVGNNPYTLQARSLQPGRLQVDGSEWGKFMVNNAALLSNSRIAIVLVER